MSRKRTVAKILESYSSATTSDQAPIVTRKRREKVPCSCDKCNGKFVDPRTKKSHENKKEESTSSEQIHSDQLTPLPTTILPNETPMSQLLVEPLDSTIVISNPLSTQTSNVYEERDFIFLPRKRLKISTIQHTTTAELMKSSSEDSGNDTSNEYITDDDIYADESSTQSEDSSDDKNDKNDSDFSNNFEDYSHPAFDLPDASELLPQDQFTWILTWIMKFRSNYKLPDTATEALIKFVKILLKECGKSEYNSFPKSLHLAKKSLGLVDQFTSFAACRKCHKLYKKDDVEQDQTIMKCSHTEFPNSATKRLKQCQHPLAKEVTLLNNHISIRSELIYPFATIQQQITSMFRRLGFEELLRHWVNRSQLQNVLSDIYDGRVWKTFKESPEIDSPNFFRPEVADSNLGLMLNLDWFQPYEGTIYSTGVLYAAICNLSA